MSARRRGLALVFLGPDGAGKSTVIAGLRAELDARGIAQHYHHLRIRVRPGRGAGVVVTDPHARPPRGVLASAAKALWFLATAWPAWLAAVRPALRRGDWVIQDRSFTDFLCDPRRYRYGGPRWLALLVDRLMPRPDALIVLHAPADVIGARKREVAPEELERQLAAYREIGRQRGALLIDTTPPPAQIVALLLSRLGVDAMDERAHGIAQPGGSAA